MSTVTLTEGKNYFLDKIVNFCIKKLYANLVHNILRWRKEDEFEGKG